MMIIVGLISIIGLALVTSLVIKSTSVLNQQLNFITQQLNERLKETYQLLQDGHKLVEQRLDSTTHIFGNVKESLGRLEQTQRQIVEISKNIASLQDLLRAPKFRGGLGEVLLSRILEDVLPKENIKLQYRFKNGEIVDAVVVIGENLLSIDAKFPWDNFKRFSESITEEQRQLSYRAFVRDVKNRIDEVSSKYILPDEGTFDFALIYIPAEAVYSYISQDEELNSYAKLRRIIFVSPNTFYAYLQAILYGLKGVNIQHNIRRILAELARLYIDFKKIQDDFELMGGHLVNASKKYNDVKEKINRFIEKLNITGSDKRIEFDPEA
ncbi:MAG: DNA recombination protein RmuC [Candidatus Omnitrophica bacterium]|nr:DNA recombination protein RmuC [Candidatus Omnitrophota bacterium]